MKLNIKQFTKEVRELTASMKAKARPYIAPAIDWNAEPISVKYNRELFEKRQQDLKKAYLGPGMKSIKRFVIENKLIYTKFEPYQHRIKNPRTGKFVDWWDGKKKTMLDSTGRYGKQGGNKVFLLQEIAKLI